jgi:hypothetical protein
MSILHIQVSLDETFDRYETDGTADIAPLVCLEAKTDVDWIRSHAYPLIYELYGSGGLMLKRDTKELGLFPARAVYISNTSSDSYLLSGENPAAIKGDVYLKYMVPVYAKIDYYDLLNQAVRKYLNSITLAPAQAQRLFMQRLHDIPRGNYPFRMSYRLPGSESFTTTRDYVFRY